MLHLWSWYWIYRIKKYEKTNPNEYKKASYEKIILLSIMFIPMIQCSFERWSWDDCKCWSNSTELKVLALSWLVLFLAQPMVLALPEAVAPVHHCMCLPNQTKPNQQQQQNAWRDRLGTTWYILVSVMEVAILGKLH